VKRAGEELFSTCKRGFRNAMALSRQLEGYGSAIFTLTALDQFLRN
jgi:hypothetical protein